MTTEQKNEAIKFAHEIHAETVPWIRSWFIMGVVTGGAIGGLAGFLFGSLK